MTHQEFFEANPVFTRKDFDAHCRARGGPLSPSGQLAALWRFAARRKIYRIRKGFYELDEDGRGPAGTGVVMHIPALAMKLAPDAVLSHRSALESRGVGWHFTSNCYYWAERPCRVFRLGPSRFIGLRHPKALRAAGLTDFDVITASDSQGGAMRVTDWCRSIVDSIRNPARGGWWEEIWSNYRSLSATKDLDHDRIVEYVRLLDEPRVAAAVGFLMDTSRLKVPCEDRILRALESMRPVRPCSIEPGLKQLPKNEIAFSERWNLVMHEFVHSIGWDEDYSFR